MRKDWLERNLVHRILCRELAVTLGAFDDVLCVKVLNDRQEVIANQRDGPEPDSFHPASQIYDRTWDTLSSDEPRHSAKRDIVLVPKREIPKK